ncbi:ADP-ribosylglycohydrolase family protein (plasmid) [Azospirillum brasilense]|nr:ADP-ribosylglycohydrolase family protein [Azospirillum brasilense]
MPSAVPFDLRPVLEAAVQAALDAGAHLRAELHRPGGPRGAEGHMPADEEAEWMIRRRLLAVLPCSYRGEETGAVEQPGAPHRWLVDPHDGTSAFLKGYRRGTAVSIALLRNHVPVLGVVYAFAFPDDGGDLIAWAEGCGPLRRNGLPIETDLSGGRLAPGSIVIVSQAAWRRTEANQTCVQPGRFLPLPSIAYRLARVAAGDAIAGVSLAAPCEWDFAAGHALLRASGGTLVDERGHAIRYDDHDRGATRWCFGGAPEAVDDLRRRPWSSVLPGAASMAKTSPRGDSVDWPRAADPACLARAQGCLLGLLAGDALGSRVEFESAAAIRARHPDGVRDLVDGGTWNTIAGQPTDDGELALALARAIIAAGRYDADRVLDAYVDWFHSAPFDIGGTTATALEAAARVASPARREAAHRAASAVSQANGSLMRVAPIGLLHAGRPDQAAEAARADSALTHPHPVCAEACAALTAGIAVAVTGADRRDVYEAALRAVRNDRAPSVTGALRAAAAPPADFETHQGWALIALQNAFHRLLAGASLQDGVIATVSCGGDTDTNAAIAGALLGAVEGRAGVPERWATAILTCRPSARAGARRVRPPHFWPDRALEIAEALLATGPVTSRTAASASGGPGT